MRSVPRARVRGPLASFADGFRVELERLGYTPLSRESKVNEMALLSRWLEREGLAAGDLDDGRVEAFLADLGARRQRALTLRAMRPLLGRLRAEGVVSAARPAGAPRGELDDLMDDYRHWMVWDRALAPRTVERYERSARRFLDARIEMSCGAMGTEGLNGQVVTGFLLAEAGRGLGPGSLQGRVAELRSLLRFLHLRGMVPSGLRESVPPVPGWKDTSVPPRLAPAAVRALLDSCDRETLVGLRDFAMLLLLARLGLRAAEVAGLRLGDLDWRAGEVVVVGKGRREDRLPLPVDVGEALAAYLTGGRPRADARFVFLTVAAPPRPLRSTSVSQMVWRQCARAGLAPVRAHRLRHALATALVDQGLALPEIAQVLRHRDLATTAAYAKVDHAALRELALPWPVGAG